jgi:hypothetical protein
MHLLRLLKQQIRCILLQARDNDSKSMAHLQGLSKVFIGSNILVLLKAPKLLGAFLRKQHKK